jgi:hypothetical protein
MSALIWECVRHNNAFLKKGHGPKTLTSEPSNVTGIHNQKFSGLAGQKVAGLVAVTKGKKQSIRMLTKLTTGKSACPKSAVLSTGVSKCAKKGVEAITKSLCTYRPDLVSAATAKYQKIKRSFRLRK